ncbi:MAG: hypothetical protein JW743_04655 [Deltaproteobacteria bacterium]|nr:hypothetical protein [Deltaproteobacteria bacterium]MBN2846318.1 hypothetical protein [Deltaproteobacteria bacterium]
MTHEDAGHYAAKHSKETELNERIAVEIRKKIREGKVSCAAAHKTAEELGVTPAEVGVAIDLLEARIERCQLGLYGYSPKRRIVEAAENVSPELEEAIRESLSEGKLTCLSSWEIAKKFGIPKMAVSSACETLGIKLSSCQLGAFK